MHNTIPPSELILNPDGSVYHLHLLPQQLADNIIAVGDPDRVKKVSQYFDTIEHQVSKREFITHTGTYKGKRISVISTGMGTDNVEIFLNELDALANIDLGTRQRNPQTKALHIVRVGTSGSLQHSVPLDAHLASHTAIGFDTLMAFYNLAQTDAQQALVQALQQHIGLPFLPYTAPASGKLLKQIAFDMVPGHTVTCPGFYAPQGRMLRLAPRINGLIDRMHSFAHQGLQLTNFEMETAGYYALGKLLGHEVLSLNAIVANRITHQFSKQADDTINSLIIKTLDRI